MPKKDAVSILVLDDDDGFRRFLATALQGAGYLVVDTGDPMEALQLLDGKRRFELLIADVQLGQSEPHGIAVANMAMLKRRRLKVIFVTGDPDKAARMIDRQATPLLSKPIRLASLLTEVRTVLASRAAP
jgi:two-component system, cell cycle sensor histidine kinase and response regulator CckA